MMWFSSEYKTIVSMEPKTLIALTSQRLVLHLHDQDMPLPWYFTGGFRWSTCRDGRLVTAPIIFGAVAIRLCMIQISRTPVLLSTLVTVRLYLFKFRHCGDRWHPALKYNPADLLADQCQCKPIQTPPEDVPSRLSVRQKTNWGRAAQTHVFAIQYFAGTEFLRNIINSLIRFTQQKVLFHLA